MISGSIFSSKERSAGAIQRLTALWAFTESGLGGVMHALQIPFTGLLVGGMAVIMISLIAEISGHNYKQVLKSAIIVVIVKAMVSPHTPFPAYIAVSFQAMMGYLLFGLLRVNFISILLLSTIAMVESAIQKLLILTLFFGTSLWKALDEMIALLARQFGSLVSNGSYWVVGIYLVIYLAGGFFIAWLAYRTIRNFNSNDTSPVLAVLPANDVNPVNKQRERNNFKKLWLLISIMLILSATLYFFADDKQKGLMSVAKTVTWTVSAILIWYMVIGPLFTKVIRKYLYKKQGRYSDEVLKTLSFIPVLKLLATYAWEQSRQQQGVSKWRFFFRALVYATLTYQEPVNAEIAVHTEQ